MKTPFITVTNDEGRTFAARYLPVGARYGRSNVLVADNKPLVEFYDVSLADDQSEADLTGFGPLGQFTGGRYYVETILGEDRWSSGEGGLILDGGVPVWTIDALAMQTVRDWLHATRANLEQEVKV